MVDPVMKPLTWNRRFHTYAEQHGFFDVIQDLLKELVIWRPEDPIMYIRDELDRISKGVHTPRVFLLGPKSLCLEMGDSMAKSCGAKFLSLDEIVETAPQGIRDHLEVYIEEGSNEAEPLRKLLVATLSRRLAMEDCVNNGYILYGFPQNRAQAMEAQMGGLLPRQVFMLLPEGVEEDDEGKGDHIPTKSEMYNLGKPKSEAAIEEIEAHQDYFTMKETLAAFNPETCTVLNYKRWITTKPTDIEAEFLGALITRKNRGAPWVPHIILIGPPATGKSSIAEFLAIKFNILNVDWMDAVRAASLWNDEGADDAKQYLEDLSPLSEQTIRLILKRRLGREDAIKKGWVLHGFPETSTHAGIMEEMGMAGNRVFLLACPDEICQARMKKRRQTIMKRRVPAFISGSTTANAAAKLGMDERDERNIGRFPYSDYAIRARIDNFNANLEDVVSYYGSFMMFVDAGQPFNAVSEFVSAAVIRPPNVRF